MKVAELIEILQGMPEKADLVWSASLEDEEYEELKLVKVAEESAVCIYFNQDPSFEGVETRWVSVHISDSV
jgi:hypothetical protein